MSQGIARAITRTPRTGDPGSAWNFAISLVTAILVAVLAMAMLHGQRALGAELDANGRPFPHVILDGKVYGTGYHPRTASQKAHDVYFAPSPAQLAAVPDNYDAEAEGLVTPFKNQGSCGSCSFFSRVAAVETAAIKAGLCTADNCNLSEQDWMVNGGEWGCSGGVMDGDFGVSHGVATEADCPYTGNDRTRCRAPAWTKLTRWAMIGARGRAPTDEELKFAIYTYGGVPVTVASAGLRPDANGDVTGRNCNGRVIDHMTFADGYQTRTDGLWLKVKNSWGPWGLNGHFYAKPGCTQLASEPGDAAMFFYIEGAPQPQPAVIEGLAEEYVVTKGNPVLVSVQPVDAETYEWSVGGGPVMAGDHVIVQTTTSTTAVLKVTDESGAVTEKSVKITVN